MRARTCFRDLSIEHSKIDWSSIVVFRRQVAVESASQRGDELIDCFSDCIRFMMMVMTH